MKTTTSTTRNAGLRTKLAMLRHQAVMARQRARPVVQVAQRNAAAMLRGWPVAVTSTRTGAGTVARAVRALPRLTVDTLTAGSLGFGAGLYLRRAPRIVKAIGVTPAMVMGASMLRRRNRHVDVEARGRPRPALRGDNEIGRLDDDGSPSMAVRSHAVRQPG